MNKILQIKNFNGLLDNFFDFLEESFVNFKADMILARSTAEFVRRSNPRLVVEQFMEYISPYKTQIIECDEAFFLNLDIKNVKNVSHDNILFGMKLKQIWEISNLTDIQKATVFYYFQQLLKTGELINSL
jgi:hypothetical protein